MTIRRGVPVVLALVVLTGGPLATSGWAGAGRGDRSLDSPRVIENVPATTNDLRAPRAQNSAILVADPTNSRFVALANRLDAPDFSCALQVSGDGAGAPEGDLRAVGVKLPSGVGKAKGCTGQVRVTVKRKGHARTLSSRLATVHGSCRFTSKVRFKNRKRFGKGRRGKLRFIVRFRGNSQLLPRRATRTARYG